MKALIVASTRPEVIKLSPVMRSLDKEGADYVFATTGQHYDYALFDVFVRDLQLKEPDYDVTVGSGSQAYQTSYAMVELEKLMMKEKPNVVIVEGDTNSVLSSALAAVKLRIPVAHVEAGLRSHDKNMPEEVNRILADHCSELLFAPTEKAGLNLINEGILPSKIFITGNTIVDATQQNLKIALEKVEKKFDGEYLVLTLHRAENVDGKKRLRGIIEAVDSLGEKVVFPAHPRTVKRLEGFGNMRNIDIIEPLGYLEFLRILKGTKAVLTDCLHPDTLVQLSNGEIKEIKDMGRERVATIDVNSLKVVQATVEGRGLKKRRKALKINHEIIASPNHRFFKLKGLDTVEIKACELKKGDFLVSVGKMRIHGNQQKLKPGINFQTYYHIDKNGLKILREKKKELKISYDELARDGGISYSHIKNIFHGLKNCNEQTLRAINRHLGLDGRFSKHVKEIKRYTHKAVTLPAETSPEFCQLVGYILGDGYSPREYTINITDKEIEVLEEYKKIVKKIFGLNPKIKYVGKRQRLIIHSKAITDFIFQNTPEIFNISPVRDIPKIITKVPNDELVAFLRGFYDAEGTIRDHSISISSTSKVLIQKIKLLLLRCGIRTNYYEHHGKRSKDVSTTYILEIYHPKSVRLFNKLIGFTSLSKSKRLISLIEKKGRYGNVSDLIPIKKGILNKIRKELKIKRDEFSINKHNEQFIRADTLSKVLKKIKSKAPHHPAIKKIESLINGDIYFTRVHSIEKIKTENLFVDIFIPQTGNFIANGYVVHNSGGIQEEAMVLKVPCFTLRTTTERPESVEAGGNVIVGVKKEEIIARVSGALGDKKRIAKMRSAKNPFGDGKSGERIVSILLDKYEKGELCIPTPNYTRGVWKRMFIGVDEGLDGKRIEELEFEVSRVIDGEEERFPRKELKLKKGQIIEIIEKP